MSVVRCAVWMLASATWCHAQDQVEFHRVDFGRDVQPILADHCFACHGPDAKAREADLRLDVRDSAVGESRGEAAIVPGKPEVSELAHRIFDQDSAQRMPPTEFNKPLNSAQKETLRRWIADGAKYDRHWSFVPPSRPALPAVKNTTWPRNPIDRFILARLEHEQLSPSAEVNRETLIRRATLDLTGLPPKPEEVDAFVHDTRAGAYERLIERLISTTTYAERRAQDWLDLARYADTRGFADDKMRQIWPYRDWVIRALSGNMPFDQFTIEQLAGDMLPDATDDQRLAAAFHRNAPQARGQTYPVEEYRVKGVVERVNTTGQVWLGLTMGCAQCHDHKFDPVTQRDYYAMFALFNNVEHRGSGHSQGGPTMSYQYLSPSQAEQRARIEGEIATARKDRLPPHLPEGNDRLIGKWQGPEVVSDAAKFNLTGNFTIVAKIRTTQTVADIASKYDWRAGQRGYVFGIGGEEETHAVPGHLFAWISARTDPFEGVEIYGSRKVNDGRNHHVAIVFNAGTSVHLFVDGIEDVAARVIGNVPKSIAKNERPLIIGAGYRGTPEPNAYRFENALGEVRIYDRGLREQVGLNAPHGKLSNLRAALKKIDEQNPRVPAVPVMRERSQTRETFIHVRGNFLEQGEQISPAVPAFFATAHGNQPRNRLEFARWLVDGKNPLVARVVVNRYWQSYFGYGLVRTPDDFGVQGSAPTHPKLLDWLATELVSSRWDMKRIHRLIVTSATYRQSARIPNERRRRDPQNRFFSRMPRVRLPAEQIRDQALAVSGLLVNHVGGESVFPRHPKGYWQQRALPGAWKESRGDDRHRRTLYTYWRRMALHPSLELLDAPARETCVARRNISNLPTQALVLLNDPIFVEAADELAARLIREVDGDDAARLDRGFRLVLGRLPHSDERSKFLAFTARERKELNHDQGVWSLVCSTLLNLDEAVTRP